jgi:hypothetical protein
MTCRLFFFREPDTSGLLRAVRAVERDRDEGDDWFERTSAQPGCIEFTASLHSLTPFSQHSEGTRCQVRFFLQAVIRNCQATHCNELEVRSTRDRALCGCRRCLVPRHSRGRVNETRETREVAQGLARGVQLPHYHCYNGRSVPIEQLADLLPAPTDLVSSSRRPVAAVGTSSFRGSSIGIPIRPQPVPICTCASSW